jgi:CMP/dCMP kinase
MDMTIEPNAGGHPLHVALDGPAGAGKSTLGVALARRLRCPYLDTGIMYRTVTAHALQQGISVQDADALAALAKGIDFSLAHTPPHALLVDGLPPAVALHTPRVDRAVSLAAAHPAVRRVLVAAQRALAKGRCIVMAGRDIGTVVLPEAPVKLWITASAEERARRRAAQFADHSHVDDIAADIRRRDEIDSTRPISPSIPASDAIVIDTDGKSRDVVLAEALGVVRDAVTRLHRQALLAEPPSG